MADKEQKQKQEIPAMRGMFEIRGIVTTFDKVELYPQVEDIRNELLEDGIIADIDGQLQFVKPYPCSSLSKAANIILHGNRNGWDWWKDADGRSLKDIPELVRKMNK